MWMYTDLNTFDGIEKIYNLIEPLRGRRKEWDIRPLQNRKKWYERIIKVNDNLYALCDGYGCWYGNPSADEERKAGDLNAVLTKTPIKWERREDGEYIQIRSNMNNSPSWSRYKFLDMYLPQGLRHGYDQSGQHWIEHNGRRHLLPKGISVYKNENGAVVESERDDKYLEFKRVGPKQFELSHGGYKKSSPIVNKEVAKQYKQAIRDLWDYARVVLPVYGYTLFDQQREKFDVLGNRWEWNKDQKMIRDILDHPEENAEKRLALCVVLAIDIGAYEMRYIVEKSGHHSFRKPDGAMFKEDEGSWDKFRRVIHRIGGMMTSKEVDFT